MTLSLSPELQKFIEERVRSGRYSSAEEVVSAALAKLEQGERDARASWEELDVLYPGFSGKVAEGLSDADAGRVSDGEEFFAELEREAAEEADAGEGRKSA